ncbi:MAG: FimV/HubP family polar landmark protein [Polaromonas sp.]|nr:FimV/HubP family polar landmark protein [Polaromonas sp.]
MAVLGSIATLPAHALGLGRVIVQSALGEPLRAEIEIVEISADEAASLRASVANANAFKAAGLEYTAAVANVQISLQRRTDGRSFLRLSSDRPVSEPFVDLILEARWASGRIVRDYTMLFDPPNLRQAAAPAMPAPTAPLISRPAAPPPVAAFPAPPRPAVAPALPSPPSPPPSRPAPVAKASAPQPAPAARPASADGQKIVVKPGDTAGKIAAQAKPASVSLDQMLVALLRSNPDAFIGGNVNRLKSGAVLEVPTGDQAEYVPAAEASRTIVAQSKDFNEFRRKLAEGAPTTQVASADRKAAGQVQAKVEDKAPAAATPDKLTLSKGAVQSKAAAEEKIAQERQAKEAADRVAELSKNISDLNKLTSAPAAPAAPATPATTPVAPATSPAAPGLAVATPAAASAAPGVLPAAAPAASAPVAAAAASPASAAVPPAATAIDTAPVIAAAPAASAPAPVKKPVVIPPPPPEPSLIDELLDNPLMLAGGAALLVLLAAFGIYRSRQRKNAVSVDSSFLESRLQPDSFFGASGGQRIDTNEANVTGSSMVYSPSQLDAAGDVDPVAEADVYLAYGRDLQAEEILKEAIRVTPTRVAIHAKLMEIYAKRRDTKAFEMVANEAFNLTRGQGVEWAHMAEMGRELDPANPMYQPGGQPVPAAASSSMAVAGASASGLAAGQTPAQAASPAPEPAAAAVDFDLDLDFSLGDEPDAPVAVATPAPVAPVQPVLAMPAAAPAPADNSLDFSSATVAMPAAAPAPAQAAAPVASPAAGNSLDFSTEAATVNTGAADLNTSGGMLEFDMGALSLDLDGPTTESPKITAATDLTPSVDSDDPLETKFALAEEFRAIGDADGARSLAEEVLAQSSGSLKSKAQAFLNALA